MYGTTLHKTCMLYAYKFMSRCCCFRNGILCFTDLVFYFRIVTLFFIGGVVSVRIVILYLTCALFNLFRLRFYFLHALFVYLDCEFIYVVYFCLFGLSLSSNVSWHCCPCLLAVYKGPGWLNDLGRWI